MAKANSMYHRITLMLTWSHVVVRAAPRKTSHTEILVCLTRCFLKTPIANPAELTASTTMGNPRHRFNDSIIESTKRSNDSSVTSPYKYSCMELQLPLRTVKRSRQAGRQEGRQECTKPGRQAKTCAQAYRCTHLPMHRSIHAHASDRRSRGRQRLEAERHAQDGGDGVDATSLSQYSEERTSTLDAPLHP
eukprot:GHVU01113254.1.p2 GENE.GHVU01113254.1~~GHVU01113254.1.p2  ORF type:complete len:191 (+),score=4.96 GHVU01113254.1:256-828(+)